MPGALRIAEWVSVVAIFVAAYYIAASESISNQIAWYAVLALMVGLFVLVGLAVVRRPLGILINERNLMSLSRFQFAVWTVLVLSAYWIMVIKRRSLGIEALVVPIDAEIWLLMGINAAALVGSPLVLRQKTTKPPPEIKAMEKTAKLVAEDVTAIETHRQGTLYGNPSPADARFSDMFEGDEVGNTGYVDLAKLQMFVFTLVVLITYARAVLEVLNLEFTDYALPRLPEGMVALLGVSNTAYLSSKAMDHTATS